jgi:hypothetical protein
MVPLVVMGPPVSPDPVFTEVTVPVPAPVLVIVILPVLAFKLIPDPAVKDNTPVLANVTVLVVPPPDRPVPAITFVIPLVAVPLLTAVRRPYTSTVRFVFVYEPAVTPELAREMVPIEVMGPPVRPIPVPTLFTVPVLLSPCAN